ncbi:dermonecrotic toxin domain-containing protein [Pseudomonas pergaminensis]
MPGTPSPLPATPASASIHNPLLEQTIPDWLIQATPQRRQAVKDAPANLPDWYHQASPVQRQAVDTATFASFSSQTQLDKAMADLQGLDAFAAPLLSQALKDALKVTLDVNKTFLRLNKTITYGILRERVGTYQVLNLSLLQAAIHNFEAAECEAGAFDETSGFVVEGATPGTFEPLSTSLTVRQFLKLCRVLNIGALYQLYLKGFLYPTDAAKAKALHDPFVAAQKDAMRAAAEMALLKKDIEPADYDMILSVIAGEMNQA